jgi:competence ComEA-like helix-hairpin-helix protein
MKKRALREYFGFTKQEQTGILVLLVLTGLCHGVPLLYQACVPADNLTDSTFPAEVAAFRQQLAAAGPPRPLPRRHPYKKAWPHRNGFSRRSFYRDSIPRRPAYFARKPLPVKINTADSAAWEALPGIGPILAARIVRFREKLGGFHSISQIAETYGLPDSTFNKIQASLRLDSSSLKKLNINEMDEKSLAQHPYIRYKLARLIVQYRSVHGPFSHPTDLLNIPLVDDSIYRKLEKYIHL